MDLLKPPQILLDAVPEGVKNILENGGWLGVLGLGAFLVLLLAWSMLSPLFRGKKPRRSRKEMDELQEDVTTIGPAPKPSGDRRLTVEGTPVRMRLLVIAPAGRDQYIDEDEVRQILNRTLTGLGDVYQEDKPRLRVWPYQLSYEGFANLFHRNTPLPEGEDEPSPWVMVAGRVKLGTKSILIGLGLKAAKPTTVGRKTLQPHEWDEVLRIRTRE